MLGFDQGRLSVSTQKNCKNYLKGVTYYRPINRVSFHIINFIGSFGYDTEQGGNEKDTYRKLVFSADGDRLIGAVFIGDISNAGLYRSVIRDHKNLDQFADNN